MKIMQVVGARPNFMKVAPIFAGIQRFPELFDQVLVHTGQHYDYEMSTSFFEQLGLPDPDEFLNAGAGSHAQQTAAIMSSFEGALARHKPDWVMVVGDVNSTLACALVCAKLGVKIAHVEAGLRSRDRSMPEEINRVLTDRVSDLLFTPSPDAGANLLNEGTEPERIRFVGNVMIDSLVKMLPRVERCPVLSRLDLEARRFALVTLHRPSNVDCPEALDELLCRLAELARDIPVVFPVHPRTRARIGDRQTPGVMVLGPLDYISFLALTKSARLVVTDSGGVQEETTFLGVPCLTIRPNTERPVTITCGTNRLISAPELAAAAREVSSHPPTNRKKPDLWDGRAAERIVGAMAEFCSKETGRATCLRANAGLSAGLS